MDDRQGNMEAISLSTCIPEMESQGFKDAFVLKEKYCDGCTTAASDTTSITKTKKHGCHNTAIVLCLVFILICIGMLFGLYLSTKAQEPPKVSADAAASSSAQTSTNDNRWMNRTGLLKGIPLSAIGSWSITVEGLIQGGIPRRNSDHIPEKTHLNKHTLMVNTLGYEEHRVLPSTGSQQDVVPNKKHIVQGASIMQFFRSSKTTPETGAEYSIDRDGKLTVSKCGMYLISGKVPLRLRNSIVQVFFYVGENRVSTCNRGRSKDPNSIAAEFTDCSFTTVRHVCKNRELDLRVYSMGSVVEIPLASKAPIGKFPNESLAYLSILRITGSAAA